MKITYSALLMILLLATPALAQQQPAQQQSTALDRISSAWGQCLGNFQQQLDEVAEIRKQLLAANARVKELETETGKKENK